jgi:probable O-glycosylation ligase (exosortase A-associated)
MRDIAVTLLVFGSLPFILMRPWIGIMMWSWLSYMNPHRLTWSFAYDMPFAAMVAATTLVGLVFAKDRDSIPWNRVTIVWFAWVIWMNITTVFAIDLEISGKEWDRTMKMQLMAFVALMLVRTQQQINIFIWVIAMSIGFFGFKGGLFAFREGAGTGIRGPAESFIEDNNALGLALVMILPLLWYLQMIQTRKIIRFGLLGGLVLCAMAVFATHSRGAFLAVVCMAGVLVLSTRGRMYAIIAVIVLAPVMWTLMPEHYHERIASIRDYKNDTSALGRINAWWFAWNLAVDRPITGGGFDTFTPPLFHKYAPDPLDLHDSHSIYFEVLAEHGFVGLALFLALGIFTLLECGRMIRRPQHGTKFDWAEDLARMLRVCLVGYATGGAFLGLAYYDLFYSLISLIVLARRAVEDQLKAATAPIAVQRGFDVRAPQGAVGRPGG